MKYSTEAADAVAKDASPEAAHWIRELARQRDLARRDYECMNKFRKHAEAQRDKLREALKPFANYACDGPCGCHNCAARAALEEMEDES